MSRLRQMLRRGRRFDEAERAAGREIGNAVRREERTGKAWRRPSFESMVADFRFALHQLRKAPGFGVTAILVLALGIAAAVTVSQRTCEIGIRMALGAERSAIGRLILGEAAHLVLLGVVCGIASSFLTGRLLRSLLFGVSAWDLPTPGAVSITLAIAALFAAWFPARRAAAIDPVRALRDER